MILFLLLIAFVTISCEEEEIKQETSIYGTWQLVGKYNGGSSEPYQSVENGYTITISSSGKATTTHKTIGCPLIYNQLDGSYSLVEIDNKSAIIFSFHCPELDDNSVDVEYYFNFENDLLILVPTKRTNTCFEGCEFNYKKISSEPQEAE